VAHPDIPSPERRRYFQDYKVLEGKEVDVGDFSDPEEAKDAVRHAMRLYDECFVQTSHAHGTKAG
jgi:inorganic pyrophosphatase